MPRPRGTKDVAGRVTRDRRRGRCQGCNAPFEPRVAEEICPECARNICAQPDVWLDRMVRLMAGDGTPGNPVLVHLEDPPRSGLRACDGAAMEPLPEVSKQWQVLCTGCAVQVREGR